MTGAGKTYFIKHVTGLDEMEIGRGFKACTKEIQIATIHMDGYEVHLIDTPGFNDEELKDTDILIQIAEYLQTGVRLSGIIYLQPMSNSRVGGAGKRNLELLRNLVGSENMGNVKLITTQWDRATSEENEMRLNDLVSHFWKGMITAGAQIDRYDGTGADGERIVRSILKTSPITLLFQREIQDGLRLEETSAGKSLMELYIKLQEKYDKDVKELKDDVAAEREAYKEALRMRDETAEQIRKLHAGKIDSMQKEIDELKKKAKPKQGTCVIL
ncbi:P-loop containing nucleoside triphosphate hydrolase protein [Hyaloscypha finlandica]|nr:P-loop containing nucleoside triphosphate hydrolase protein [Hyaloscypha finlandica]